jgi:hypothetical protein
MTPENTPETANAPDTIVLIHGLWMTPRSWEKWAEHYTGRAYRVLTPAYPGLDAPPSRPARRFLRGATVSRPALAPWVGVISFGAAALIGYLISPVIAILLFVWMIAYHAATSEGLGANRIARLFALGRLGHTAGTEDEHVDPRPEPLDRQDVRPERPEDVEPRDPPH